MSGIDVDAAFPRVEGFVTRGTREQLMEAFAELVYDVGYTEATIGEAAVRVDVAPRLAHVHFDDKAECALEAADLAAQRCFSAVARAYMTAPGDCPMAAHRALRVMLEYMASMPALMYLAMIELPRLGERARQLRSRDLELFGEFLGPGFAAAERAGRTLPHAEVSADFIGGGIYEVVRRFAIERRLEDLPEALPAISYLCTLPFFGTAEARRVSASV